MPTNKLIHAVPASPTLAIDALAKKMKSEGVDVVGFGAGEPDFDTPAHINEAAMKAIRDGKTRYEPVGGVPALVEAIRGRIKADHGLDYTASQILVSCGAKHTIYNLLMVALEPGDEVIVLAPYWVSYPAMVTLAGGKSVIVESTAAENFVPPIERIAAAITPKTKMIILNSPSNPTGAVIEKGWLEKLGELVLKHNLYVISDEIYDKLVYDGFKPVSFATLGKELYARTALVNGASKAYAMTGWRIGHVAGPEDWVKAANKLQGQSTSNATSIAQYAAAAAFSGDQGVVETMRQAFERRRTLIVGLLNAIPGFQCYNPKGAFYAFPRIADAVAKSKYKSSDEWALALLNEKKVAVVAGEGFGAPGYIRLSYATSDDNIRKGLSRVAEFVKESA